MPQTIPRETAIRDALADSVQHALKLSMLLELLVTVKPTRPSGGFHGKVDFSQPPWYAPVAHAITDLHAFSRQAEREIRGELGLPRRERGGSAGNTAAALGALTAHAHRLDDGTVLAYTRKLERWSRTAKAALNITELPKRLPRQPGQAEPECPFCSRHTLRARPLDGLIFCIDKECTDEAGNRPRARLEFSKIGSGGMVLVWQDGISGVPA